jgi:thiamine-monophosphate kinase
LNSEFELIDLFNQIGSKYYKENGVIVPPGDDCAVFESKKEIVTSVDASVEGIHFLKDTAARDIAYRSIAIAISDIAAMGCNPLAFSLSVTSPFQDREWFEDFAKGTREISHQFRLPLIGGDLTRGPLNINVIVYGSPFKKNILISYKEYINNGLDAIISNTSGCGTTLKDYGFIFKSSSDLKIKP